MKEKNQYDVISNKPIKYLPEKTSYIYDFLILFSSILFINNDTYFNINKLIYFIDDCQKNYKHQNLLNNFYIRDNKYNSFNKAIKLLKMNKDITEIKCQHRNTQYYDHIILISKRINLKRAFTKNSKKAITEMTHFVNDYYNYLSKDIYIDYKKSAKVHVRRLSLNKNTH